ATAVVDATGTAEIVRLIDPALVHDDTAGAAAGLIFRLRGVEPAVREFSRNLQVVRALQRAAEEGELPPGCRKAWLDRGIHDDEMFVKLLVPSPRDVASLDKLEACRHEDAMVAAVVRFLVALPGFGGARLTATGEVGVRDGGRVIGEYCLTAD